MSFLVPLEFVRFLEEGTQKVVYTWYVTNSRGCETKNNTTLTICKRAKNNGTKYGVFLYLKERTN